MTTARLTGLFYLGLAVFGVAFFLVSHAGIYDPDSATATLANLVESDARAHLDVALALAVVLTQALAAVWFFKLFRPLNEVAAWAVAAYGLINAALIAAGTACLAAATAVASDESLAPGGDAAATVQLLHTLDASLWSVGAVFFGLWLIPMGWVAVKSGRFPAAMGWILIVGGVGYTVSAFLDVGMASGPTWLVDAAAAPATIGEFWMMGYLLTVGIRPEART